MSPSSSFFFLYALIPTLLIPWNIQILPSPKALWVLILCTQWAGGGRGEKRKWRKQKKRETAFLLGPTFSKQSHTNGIVSLALALQSTRKQDNSIFQFKYTSAITRTSFCKILMTQWKSIKPCEFSEKNRTINVQSVCVSVNQTEFLQPGVHPNFAVTSVPSTGLGTHRR